MRISNNFSTNTRFGELLCTDVGLNSIGKKLANSLEDSLSYDPRIDQLDKRGIDVIIYPVKDKYGDKAKVSIIDSDNNLYKYKNNDFVSTIKKLEFHDRRTGVTTFDFDDNYRSVSKYIDSVLSGTAKKTSRKTKSLNEILEHFPLRRNFLDRLFR